MDDGEDVISNFMAITGSTESDAVMYLSMHDFDLQQAVVVYQSDHSGPTGETSRPELQDVPSPSVDSGSPSSPQPPMSYTMGGFGSPSEGRRPATPPAVRTLASGSNEQLQRLFARPSYVTGSDSASFAKECERAAERRSWMLVAVVDSSFPCECFTRDVWASDAMRSLTSGSIFCYEVNVTHSRGVTIAEKYGVNVDELPVLFIVDPVTMFKVEEVPLVSTEAWRFDSALIVDTLMLFITSREPPQDPFSHAAAAAAAADSEQSIGPLPSVAAVGAAPLVVDVDSEAEMMSPPTVTPSATAPARDSFAEVAPPPVSIEEYTVQDGSPEAASMFKLRCRLPHSSHTLQLRPDTPVTKLMSYLAYVVHSEDKEKFALLPVINIFSGFPPRNVTAGEMEGVTLSNWTGVRSGDVVMVRVSA